MMGPYGTPLYASASGTVYTGSGGLGGKTVWLIADYGTGFYYAHLDTFARAMPHLAIIRKLRPRMGPTKFTFWTVQGSALPVTWDEAIERLMSSAAIPGPGAP